MKKFIVHSQRGFSIMEVEGSVLTALEDPSVMWAPKGEYRLRITAPESLQEKYDDGSLRSPIYCSFALYETIDEAKEIAERYIRGGFAFEVRKGRLTSYTEEEVQAEIAKIKIVML